MIKCNLYVEFKINETVLQIKDYIHKEILRKKRKMIVTNVWFSSFDLLNLISWSMWFSYEKHQLVTNEIKLFSNR